MEYYQYGASRHFLVADFQQEELHSTFLSLLLIVKCRGSSNKNMEGVPSCGRRPAEQLPTVSVRLFVEVGGEKLSEDL